MNTLLHRYARGVAASGMIILVAALLFDRRWLEQPLNLLALTAAAVVLRAAQLPLTKYSALQPRGRAPR